MKISRFFIILLLFLFPLQLLADELNPAVYLMLDTSGSMLETPDGTPSYGDGSIEHPSNGLDSRLWMAKNAITSVINAYGEVRWGFARFQQNSGINYFCMCHDETDNNSSCTDGIGLWDSADNCETCDLSDPDYPDYDLPGTHDRVCINYAGGIYAANGHLCTDPFTELPLEGADILVPLGDDASDNILKWINHHENDPGNPVGSGSDPEIRAVGGTPLGGSLQTIYNRLSQIDIHNDPRRGCRPYAVILLTDGNEECGTDPESVAAQLLQTPDLQSSCSNDSQCSSGVCNGGHCIYEVKTYVIGFGLSPQQWLNVRAIAQAGGTEEAIPAYNQDDISTAMAQIIASSIVNELCNGIDDDCDGYVDEDFPVGDTCNNGLLGECYRDGNYICTADETGVECDAPDISPSTEVCDELDNDCNGLIDDVSGGCPDPGPEMCNGVDDDLDGSTADDGDDDPAVGQVCGSNTGICEEGITKCIGATIVCCENSGDMHTCTSVQGPQTETCNHLDDNCNGSVDEGLSRSCYTGPIGTVGHGICHAGIQICNATQDGVESWGACQGEVTPQTEVCDGVDNDCDSSTDEDLGSITCGLGACEHTIQSCSGGTVQSCDPTEGAVTEICNNIDDDCNGAIDDGVSRSCYTGPAGTEGKGICHSGLELCSAGAWVGECSGEVTPGTEICNGLDDDCDDSTDEGLSRSCYTGPAGTEGVGICHGGTQVCIIAGWGECNGEVTPGVEICDGDDNDCNGVADDMGTTTCGLGICEHTIQNCEGGIVQTCDPLEGAQTEICDGLDNDCDGQADGLSRSCYPNTFDGCTWDDVTNQYICKGICSTGLQICAANSTGIWGICEGYISPQTEICDGLDNDCDDSIDEDLTESCYPPGSGSDATETGCMEVSDGSWICEGECQVGERVCSGGSWGMCQNVVMPESEVCDGLDNDCDGLIDEDIPGMGEPCGGVGVCAPGTRQCISGVVVCDGGGDPQPGLCDGLDNNCNGLVDEPEELAEDPSVGAGCGESEGACEEGHNECIDGTLVCVGGIEPTGEMCNGFDDDCNGEIDEGDICESDEICYEADCRLLCEPNSEHACPSSFECIEANGLSGTYICYPQIAPCGNIYCENDEVCRDGTCVNPCEPSPCESWEKCQVNRYAGQIGHENDDEYICYDNSCSSGLKPCANGKFCVNHECIEDPCFNDPCEFGTEYCERVGCKESEDATTSTECSYKCENIPYCKEGEKWDKTQSKCVDDSCYNIECKMGEICSNGVCEQDPCFITNCDWHEVCVAGECVSDPCKDIKCPYYTHCYIDQNTATTYCALNEGVWTPPKQGDSMTGTGNGFACNSAGRTNEGLMPVIMGFVLAMLMMFGGKIRQKYKKTGRITNIFFISLIFAFGLFFGSCKYQTYTLNEEGKIEIPDAEIIQDSNDVQQDDIETCIPTEEICNDKDDDCDGIVDNYWTNTSEGGEGHFSDDLFNCGSCGNICAFVHAAARCENGQCVMGACKTNWYDFNNDPSDGCEAGCVISSGGQEICDGVDNDCDGIIDNHWASASEGGEGHFADDPNNCGQCGRVCAFPNGIGSCENGQCTLSSCNSGYADADGQSGNGCECIITASEDSSCDGVDNDCDGSIDEDFVSLQCYAGGGCTPNGDGTFNCVGTCRPGMSQCNGGQLLCIGQISPTVETCDGTDNNCDGSIDEGYDLNSDNSNCGGCGNVCNLTGAISVCSSATCVISSCQNGHWNLDGINANGCEYACVLSNNGIERCDDGIDNDCDGNIDEFNADTDVNNCGSCGYSCSVHAPNHTVVTGCSGGTCQYTCAEGYHDFDSDMSNGCEKFCVASNGGVEACDGLDNDCDNLIDEDFDKNTDINNCGSCGYSCSANAPNHMLTTACIGGVCQYECSIGYWNLNGSSSDGCEYSCTITNGGTEICDNADNDCDGSIDENSVGLPLTQSCYTGPAGTEGVGLCHNGTQQCISGSWGTCNGDLTPQSESCNGSDDDCDGSTDEDYNTNTDVLNCGGCGNSCFTSVPNNMNVTGCSGGVCQYTCAGGYYNINGSLIDGCEYACNPSLEAGKENCNGIDDDCDGDIDETSDLLPPPSGYCKTGGGCGSGVSSTCTTFEGATTWVCNYPSYVEVQAHSPNKVAYSESLCDNYDNDCDGSTDEDFLPIKGSACEDSDIGRCKGTGTIVCKSDHSGTECNITDKESPINETCNGEDDDCDGLVDEPVWNPGTNPSYVVDDVETISVDGHDVYVYKYEASRPEATSSDPGIGSDVRSCSKPNVIPWEKITYAQAQLACAKTGMRLCKSDEWQKSCEGSGNIYPYGNTYSSNACNGKDNTSTPSDTSVSTGSLGSCFSEDGIFDLSGNLKEWTQTLVTYSDEGRAVYEVRGGSYNENQSGLTCSIDNSNYTEDTFTPYIGFRCCTTCGNGTVESGEACDDGNDVNGDGCDALCAVDNASQTCGNGIVEGSEECDDGNRMPLDGCSSTCKNEGEICSSLYPGDEDGDGLANCNDPDCSSARHCDPDYQDNDSDGFTPNNGDCNDSDPTINPATEEICNDGIDNNCNGLIDNSEGDQDGDGVPRCSGGSIVDCNDYDEDQSPENFEVAGDGKDNDCDGIIDEDEYACDCGGSVNQAQAMGLCNGVLSLNSYYASNSHGVASSYGNLSPLVGCRFFTLSTGIAWSTSVQVGSNMGTSGNVVSDTGCMVCTDPDPNSWAHPGPEGCCENDTTNDPSRLRIQVKVPNNARSFSFKFIFLSAEYPEYVHTVYNDTLYVVVHSSALSDVQNISFAPAADASSLQPMTVNNGYFEDPQVTDIGGTGYDVSDPHPPDYPNSKIGSSTGWLTTKSPCTPGETMIIDFWIHDEYDHIYDSAVVIDDFEWFTTTVDGPVTTK